MKKLIKYLLELTLGDDSKQVDISEEKSGQERQITLQAPSELLGRLIGRNGQVAKAFKNFLAIRTRGQETFRLDIKEKTSKA